MAVNCCLFSARYDDRWSTRKTAWLEVRDKSNRIGGILGFFSSECPTSTERKGGGKKKDVGSTLDGGCAVTRTNIGGEFQPKGRNSHEKRSFERQTRGQSRQEGRNSHEKDSFAAAGPVGLWAERGGTVFKGHDLLFWEECVVLVRLYD